MKKTLLIIAVFLVTGFSATFANSHTTISQQVVAAFNNDFKNATHVEWQQGKDFVKATFTMNGQVLFAYYNANNELMGVVRNLTSDHLPITLFTDLKKNYSDNYWITDLFEMVQHGQTSYYVTLENADQKIVLKADGITNWSVYQKTKKDEA